MADFSFLNNLYLKIFPKKLTIKRAKINSNHQALYTHILAVSVLYQLSINVPNAIAVEKAMNSMAINWLENKYFGILSFISIFTSSFDVQRYLLKLNYNNFKKLN
jgi:hypothetical protein